MKQSAKHRPVTTKGVVVTTGEDSSLLNPCGTCGVIRREHDSEIAHPYNPAASPVDMVAVYARQIEATAALMIGCFSVACGGRHHYGRTCDYCLADDVLRSVRALLARVGG